MTACPSPLLLPAVCRQMTCRRPPPHTGSAPPPSALDVQLLHSLLRHMGPNRPTARALIARLPRITVPALQGQPQPADTAHTPEGEAVPACMAGQQQEVTAASEGLPQQQQQQVLSEQQAVTAGQGQSRLDDVQQEQEQQHQQVKVFCVAGEPCTVCHEDFVAGHQVLQLPCCHCFHEACLHPWLREVRAPVHPSWQQVSAVRLVTACRVIAVARLGSLPAATAKLPRCCRCRLTSGAAPSCCDMQHNTCPVCRYELEPDTPHTAAAAAVAGGRGGADIRHLPASLTSASASAALQVGLAPVAVVVQYAFGGLTCVQAPAAPDRA